MALGDSQLYTILTLTLLRQILLADLTGAVFYTPNSHNDFPTLGKRQDGVDKVHAKLLTFASPRQGSASFSDPGKRFHRELANDGIFAEPSMDFSVDQGNFDDRLVDAIASARGGRLNHAEIPRDVYKEHDLGLATRLTELLRRLKQASDYALLDNDQFDRDSGEAGVHATRGASDEHRKRYASSSRAWMALSPLLRKRPLPFTS